MLKRNSQELVETESSKRFKYSDELVPFQESYQALVETSLNNKTQSKLIDTNMVLTGHENAIYSLSFDPTGRYMCSASLDRKIC